MLDDMLDVLAATFGWLCVETIFTKLELVEMMAATFGWLCVETLARNHNYGLDWQPPSGGCVLKQYYR